VTSFLFQKCVKNIAWLLIKEETLTVITIGMRMNQIYVSLLVYVGPIHKGELPLNYVVSQIGTDFLMSLSIQKINATL